MKLQCTVNVVNRVHSELNIKLNGKYLKSTLAIGKEPKSEKDYFIIHFSSVKKEGTKYRIKNIKQVFAKCLNEGMVTIRFEVPTHDLLIKCEVLQLKCFMRILKYCIVGDTKNIELANLCSVSVIAKDSAPTKLVIKDRSEFPSTGLPRTLESVHMNGLKLCNFRREILLLRNLVILDLSNNEIEKIPYEFGRMPNLSELYLSNNKLGGEKLIDWRWLCGKQLVKSLKLLDLSGNKLAYLPNNIWQLQKLVTLKLDNNSLWKLPVTLGRISSLRYLTISKNKLEYLPCSLMHCKLEYIDLSVNDFLSDQIKSDPSNRSPWDLYVGSLVNLSSKIVLKYKLHYAPNVIPFTLVENLDNANLCICGAPVVNNNVVFIRKELDLNNMYRVVVFDENRNSLVPFNCCFCSPKCFNKW